MMTRHNPVKICHLITELSSGGAQSELLRLLREQDRQQYVPSVACLYNGDAAVAQAIRALDVSVVDLGMKREGNLRGFLNLERWLRAERPTILHTWMFHANVPGRILGRIAGIPVIITSRQNVVIGGVWRERMTGWTAPLDDAVIAVCEAARQAEIANAGGRPDKVFTIYNGVDLTEFAPATPATRAAARTALGVPNAALLLGCVGRLHPQKGIATLLDALALLRDNYPQLHLCLIGTGELHDSLQAQTHSLGLEGMVTFTGVRTDVPRLLAALDVFVLPSLWEGMPNVLLEAMAAGLPIVSTAVGGTPEVIVEGVTGLLVPPGEPTALATALRSLIENPALRLQFGQAGRARAEQEFSLAHNVAQITALYARCLAAKNLS